MSIIGIDHVQLAMPPGREDDARAFYGQLLGMARLQDAGTDVVDDVSLPGIRRAYVSDPFGNRIELVEASA